MYDEAELLALKNVLTVFKDYIWESETFDVVYSRKFGYLFMSFKDDIGDIRSVAVESAESLCSMLFYALACDVVDAMECVHPSHQEREAAVMAHLQPYLDRLPEYAHLVSWGFLCNDPRFLEREDC